MKFSHNRMIWILRVVTNFVLSHGESFSEPKMHAKEIWTVRVLHALRSRDNNTPFLAEGVTRQNLIFIKLKVQKQMYRLTE
jgi:hypothetical protein